MSAEVSEEAIIKKNLITSQTPKTNRERMIAVETIAQKLGAEVRGNKEVCLTQIKPLEDATKTDLSFFSPTAKRKTNSLLELARNTQAGALLIPQYEPEIHTTQIITPNPLAAVIALAPLFSRLPEAIPGVHPQAVVGDGVTLGKNVSIGAFAVIGDEVVIGDDTVIHPHVVIYAGASIGKRCILHAGAVIREFVSVGDNCVIQNGVVVGGDGFGYTPNEKGEHQRIPHLGTTVLEDGVDIGANATVDRAMLGETRIGAGTKIDNLVMVGHNVKVGKNNIFCSQVGISGSTKLGNNVVLAGQVGVADHIVIGNNVRAAARSGITRDIAENTDIGGFPAGPSDEWRRQAAITAKLPDLYKRLQELEKKVS